MSETTHTPDRVLAVMALMNEVQAPYSTYLRAVRRAYMTATDSPENNAAKASGNAALLDIEEAVRRWVAKHPGAECRQALLSLGTPPPERCTVRGPHTEHVTAADERWTDAADEQDDPEPETFARGRTAKEAMFRLMADTTPNADNAEAFSRAADEERAAAEDDPEPAALLRRCPAKHGALGRICELDAGHDGFHTGEGPNSGAVWEGGAS